MTLHKLVEKICNRSTSVVGKGMIGNLIEFLCSFMIVRGKDCESFSKHHEVFEQRHRVLMRHGFDAATDSVRDTYSNEF